MILAGPRIWITAKVTLGLKDQKILIRPKVVVGYKVVIGYEAVVGHTLLLYYGRFKLLGGLKS